jgi:hypothetical protein
MYEINFHYDVLNHNSSSDDPESKDQLPTSSERQTRSRNQLHNIPLVKLSNPRFMDVLMVFLRRRSTGTLQILQDRNALYSNLNLGQRSGN